MRKSIPAVLIVLSLSSFAGALTVLEPGYTVETFTEYYPTRTHSYSMTFDNAGYLYLSHPYDDLICRVERDGTISEFADLGNTTSGVEWTGGTAFGDYIYATSMYSLVRIAPDGATSPFATGFPAASEVAVDTTGVYGGYLYVSTGGQDHIYRVDPNGAVSMFSEWPGRINGGGPVGMEFDKRGDYGWLMYVATSFGPRAPAKSGIFILDPNGVAIRFAESLVVGREIAFDTRGLFGYRMFAVAADTLDEVFSIWWVAPGGMATQFATTTQSSTIGSLVFGPDGALYVNEFSADEKLITVSRVVPPPRRF